MAVSTGSVLQSMSNRTLQQGYKLINSDFALEIKGFEHTHYLAKQAPWAVVTPGSEIEVPMPNGQKHWQPAQGKGHQQGAISLLETESGHIEDLLQKLLVNGGRFDCKVYQGTPEKYSYYKVYTDCFMVLEPVDRDFENNTQVLMYAGTMFYHYYGETVRGLG